MQRIVGAFALVLIGVIGVMTVGHSKDVMAGHSGGLSGRTHVVVKEHNLKVLKVVLNNQSPDVVNGGTLREQFRNGGVDPNDYEVPANRVFVATDAFVRLSSPNSVTLNFIDGWLGTNNTPFVPLHAVVGGANGNGSLGVTASFHFTGGIPYSPGSVIQMASLIPNVTGNFEFTVLGYETVDVAPIGN